jgi:hypothetical protein
VEIFGVHAPTVPYADKGIEALDMMRRSVVAKAEVLRLENNDNVLGSNSTVETLTMVDTDLSWDESMSSQVDWEELLNSNAMDQNWLTSLDFGEDNWMLHHPGELAPDEMC